MATLSKPEIGKPIRKEPRKAEALQSIVRTDREGTALWFLGGLYEVKVSSKETGNRLCVVQMTLPSGVAAPPHIHDCDESVTVLAGTLRCHIGEVDVRDLDEGDVVYFPEGTLEWFENVSDETAKILVTYTPGGMDEFFLEAAEPARTRDVPPKSSAQPDVDRLTDIAARHGLQIRAQKPH